jgi:hypothetical protein
MFNTLFHFFRKKKGDSLHFCYSLMVKSFFNENILNLNDSPINNEIVGCW